MKSIRLKAILLASAALMGTFATALQDNWQKFTTKDGKLSIKLPQTWGILDANDPNFQAALRKINELNPKLAKSMDPSKPTNYALQCYDYGDDISDGAMDNMNVVIAKNPGITEKEYGLVGNEILKGIEWDGKGNQKVVSMPQGKMLHYWGTMKFKVDETTTSKADVMGYLMIKGENLYILTFSMGGGQMGKKRENVEKMMKTVEVS
jgi:hypothetical protein